MERWNTILKLIKDGVPSFHTILSAIRTPTYKLSKFFVPLLTSLTLNEYTIKDSFSFAEELSNYDSNLVMASFDVESLFTNISINVLKKNLPLMKFQKVETKSLISKFSKLVFK